MDYLPHEQRMIEERQDLGLKMQELCAFTRNPKFFGLPEAEQVRIIAQLDYMRGYYYMLSSRISAFTRAHEIEEPAKPKFVRIGWQQRYIGNKKVEPWVYCDETIAKLLARRSDDYQVREVYACNEAGESDVLTPNA